MTDQTKDITDRITKLEKLVKGLEASVSTLRAENVRLNSKLIKHTAKISNIRSDLRRKP
jgi:phage shock protein A